MPVDRFYFDYNMCAANIMSISKTFKHTCMVVAEYFSADEAVEFGVSLWV
jgi:hypothetical protein